MIPIFGITIPVIIRIGDNNTKVNLSDISLQDASDTTKILDFKINRSGNMSVYGDIKVVHISPSGKETEIGALNGLAVYTPNAVRRVMLELIVQKSVNYNTGKLKITFSAQSETRPEIYALAEYELIKQ